MRYFFRGAVILSVLLLLGMMNGVQKQVNRQQAQLAALSEKVEAHDQMIWGMRLREK